MLIEPLRLFARRHREIIDVESGALQMCFPTEHYTEEEALEEHKAKYL